MLAAALAAAASAGGFAISTSLQHQAAERVDAPVGAFGLLLRLARQPVWLMGIAFGGLAFGLHALALSLGALALVQPIMVSGIVFAVVVRAALERSFPTTPELWAVSATAVGLALFLVATDPTESGAEPRRTAAAALVVSAGVVSAVLVATHRRWRVDLRPMVLGMAAGLLFGLSAGLTKLVTHDLTEPRWSTVVAALGVAVCGLSGVAVNQQAYRLGPLSASMPALNVVSVCLAVAFGGVAFGDYPSLGTLAVAGQVVALVLIGIGLRVVAVDLDTEGVTARAD